MAWLTFFIVSSMTPPSTLRWKDGLRVELISAMLAIIFIRRFTRLRWKITIDACVSLFAALNISTMESGLTLRVRQR